LKKKFDRETYYKLYWLQAAAELKCSRG